MSNKTTDWITEEREKIIEIYEIVMSEKCPGLQNGEVFQKTNGEMLEAIRKFVIEKVEPI